MREPEAKGVRRRLLLRVLTLALPAACARPRLAARPEDRGLSGALASGEVPASVVVLGRAYLDRFPAEADIEVLRSALGLDRAGESERARSARLGAFIEREIDDDELVSIAGWLLAPTECRICALAALSV